MLDILIFIVNLILAGGFTPKIFRFPQKFDAAGAKSSASFQIPILPLASIAGTPSPPAINNAMIGQLPPPSIVEDPNVQKKSTASNQQPSDANSQQPLRVIYIVPSPSPSTPEATAAFPGTSSVLPNPNTPSTGLPDLPIQAPQPNTLAMRMPLTTDQGTTSMPLGLDKEGPRPAWWPEPLPWPIETPFGNFFPFTGPATRAKRLQQWQGNWGSMRGQPWQRTWRASNTMWAPNNMWTGWQAQQDQVDQQYLDQDDQQYQPDQVNPQAHKLKGHVGPQAWKYSRQPKPYHRVDILRQNMERRQISESAKQNNPEAAPAGADNRETNGTVEKQSSIETNTQSFSNTGTT